MRWLFHFPIFDSAVWFHIFRPLTGGRGKRERVVEPETCKEPSYYDAFMVGIGTEPFERDE